MTQCLNHSAPRCMNQLHYPLDALKYLLSLWGHVVLSPAFRCYYWHELGSPFAHYLSSKTLIQFHLLVDNFLRFNKALVCCFARQKTRTGHSLNSKYLLKYYQIYTLLLSLQANSFQHGILVHYFEDTLINKWTQHM